VRRDEYLPEVVARFEQWLYLPDPGALLAALGAVSANLLAGDPLWLVLVGPPGGGKTELLNALAGLEHIHPAATLTEGALLSGTPGREREAGTKGGLLREIGAFGIILCKDFGSVLSMNRDARAAVLAALREVFDGSWTRHVGTGGGRTLHWQGKVGLVAGCTPTIDRHHVVMGAMGERFLLFRLPEVGAVEQARRALGHAGREATMRVELAEAVAQLFALPACRPRRRSTEDDERLISLASLVARARSAVERDGYSREIELIPGSEAPTRLVVVLARLLAGLDAVGASREQAWPVLTKAALDCIPAIRRQAIAVLASSSGQLETGTVAEAIVYPTQTTRRALEDLTAHGIAVRESGGKGKSDRWELTSFARERYAAAEGVPEMSIPISKSASTDDDFSGKVISAGVEA
jgi:energy-coupling factor transporter ATP-binding protein EcfA2